MKINVSNSAKIQSAIDAVQVNCRARTINATDVQAYAERLQTWLDGILHRKDQVGLTFYVDAHAQSFPGAYKGIPQSTKFTLTRTSTGFFLINAYRTTCGGPSQVVNVDLSDRAEELARFAAKTIQHG